MVADRVRRAALIGALLVAGPVAAYTLTGPDWAWQTFPVEDAFRTHASSFPPDAGGGAQVRAALLSGVDPWNDEGGAWVALRKGPDTTALSWGAIDGAQVLQFHASTTEPGLLARARTWSDGTNLFECDVRFYGANGRGPIAWSSDPAGAAPGRFDLARVSAHELGHCIGLGHSDDPTALMYPTAGAGTGPEARHLAEDDQLGLIALYGAYEPPEPAIGVSDALLWDNQLAPARGDGDGQIEAGEVFALQVEAENYGDGDAYAVQVEVSFDAPELRASPSSASLGELAPGERRLQTPAFAVQVAPDCARSGPTAARLRFTDSSGGAWEESLALDLRCGPPGEDRDGDGAVTHLDCDDNDPSVHPGAPERCDGEDQDCDGLIDESAADAIRQYRDVDGDGWGNTANSEMVCPGTPGWSARRGDCDDGDVGFHPGAVDRCDGRDQSCDGLVDNPPDTDGDGHNVCGGDCDEADAGVFPGAPERCNDRDDDCDGEVDESGSDARRWYRDADGDDWGNAANSQTACARPAGYTPQRGDCNDARAEVFPGAPEVCNGRDDDCDGLVDDGVSTRPWYLDRDDDGYGGLVDVVHACAAPADRIAEGGDCDDTDPSVSPAALERCGGDDEDCDGLVDEGEAIGARPFHADADGDGAGDPSRELLRCAVGPGVVDDDSDCDDTDASVFPGAPERCDGLDQDCDGAADEELPTGTWFADGDGDGAGDPARPQLACGPLPGLVSASDDCDDADPAVFPGAAERCDGVDQDCDGLTDEDAVDARRWLRDADGDGAGDPRVVIASCAAVPGYVLEPVDCDDTDPNVGAGAPEVCNGVDDDCDGVIDGPGAGGERTWYFDLDGDGFGAATTSACEPPPGYVALGGDCDDSDPSRHPEAAERCDGADDDCDGAVDEDPVDPRPWYLDADLDGFGAGAPAFFACDGPLGTSDRGDDCAPEDPAVHPEAAERCDGLDQDCDGQVDEGVRLAFYADADGDGHGDPSVVVEACEAPAGYVAQATDCDDAQAEVSPSAVERCDGADTDCDGQIDAPDPDDGVLWYLDADADGWGDDAAPPVRACEAPAGRAATAGDCDDADPSVAPELAERCDGVDQDCDGAIDEGLDWVEGWVDADGDGHGDPARPLEGSCAPDQPISDSPTDCDDARPDVHPGAEDPPGDGLDADCDGLDDVPDTGEPLVGHYTGRACGCASSRGGLGWLGLLPLALAFAQRRSPR